MLISVLGIFVADLAFFAEKIPVEGETVIGNKYVIGPGGKGSNQAVAAAKAGAKTYFISKIGDDQLFYLMSRGISEEDARKMIVHGFIDGLVKKLPLEYAVEMNRLIDHEMEGSIG